MKVLKRITLKNVSEYLSDREMKQVRGGADLCPQGQTLFRCILILSWHDGHSWSGDGGVVCAETMSQAAWISTGTASYQMNAYATRYEDYVDVTSECMKA